MAPLSTLLNVVETERSFGNHCFNQSRYEDAKHRYKQVGSGIQGLFYKNLLLRTQEGGSEFPSKFQAPFFFSAAFSAHFSFTQSKTKQTKHIKANR